MIWLIASPIAAMIARTVAAAASGWVITKYRMIATTTRMIRRRTREFIVSFPRPEPAGAGVRPATPGCAATVTRRSRPEGRFGACRARDRRPVRRSRPRRAGWPTMTGERMTGYTRGALRFDVVDGGPADADETVLLLHGFPQTSASWAPVADRLHAAGLRTLAPDQRGYSPGARPGGRAAYRVEHLVDDAAALVTSSGAGSVHVVGHDWGAVVAWALAAHRPELVRTVTGVSVPHPAA